MRMEDLKTYFETKKPAMIEALRELVEQESPSTDKALLDGFVRRYRDRVAELVDDLQIFNGSDLGDILRLEIHSKQGEGQKPALLLCHYDTVWAPGTLAERPFQNQNGRLYGPGVLDMKGGIVLVEFALRAIRELSLPLARPVIWILNGDEEVGSMASRSVIEESARQAAFALVMEPPLPGGVLKIARKGTGRFVLRVRGIEAHSGINPGDGANAIVELAHQILAIARLADETAGTTVNVGVISGGSRPNVIAGTAEAQIDVRVWKEAEARRVENAFRALRPVLKGTRIELEGGFTRPPMEPVAGTRELLRRAQVVASQLNQELEGGETGGASDGNFTAALGVPTLDGLGPKGAGAHMRDEYVETDSLVERASLLTALLLKL